MPIPLSVKEPAAAPEKKSSRFLQAQVNFICKHALGIVIAFAVVTAALIPLAARLELHANFLDLLPTQHSSIVNLKKLMSHVGGTSFLIAVIESPDEETSLNAAKAFSDKARSLRQIESIDNRTHSSIFQYRKLLFLNLESIQKLKQDIQGLVGHYRRASNPFYVDLLSEEAPAVDTSKLELEEKVSRIGGFSAKEKDSYMQVVLLKPKHAVTDFVSSEALFAETNAAFAEVQKQFEQPVTLGLTGPYRTRYAEYKTITRDLKRTGAASLILLLLINVIAFRNLRSLVYAYLPLVIGTVWTWAFAEVSLGYLNLITSFCAVILFGMGGDFTFHILVSFEEDLESAGGNVEKAVQMTFSELWTPLWSSMWTTAVVFYAMMVSQFEGFRHFGIIAGVGIVISFLVVLYLQPSLIILIEKYFPRKRRAPRAGLKLSKPLIYAVISAGILFTAYSFTQVPHAKFDYNFNDLQSKDNDSIELSERIGKHFGVNLSPVIFMAPDRETASKLAGRINAYIDTHSATLFDFAAALTSHVPRSQEEKIKVLGEIDALLKKYQPLLDKQNADTRKKITDLQAQLHPTAFGVTDLPDGTLQQYEGKDQQISIVFVYPNQRIFNGEIAMRFIREARNFPVPEGVQVAGEAVIYSDILSHIGHDAPIAIWVSAIVVFVLVLIHFKRLSHVLWVHAPLAIGLLWMIGMMGLTDLKFNFFNMVVIPSILGVGIDNGIYIFDRYRKRGDESFFESMGKSLKGVLLASATNIAGFASVMFASHRGISSLGQLGFFGFLGCLLSSVFFIPAVIEFFEFHYEHLFRRGDKKDISRL